MITKGLSENKLYNSDAVIFLFFKAQSLRILKYLKILQRRKNGKEQVNMNKLFSDKPKIPTFLNNPYFYGMRYLIFILLLFIYPAITFSQTRADYEAAINKFQGFYNHFEPDSICNMFAHYSGKPEACLYNKEHLLSLAKQYGRMKSYQYYIQKDSIALFKIEFIRSMHIMAISLNKQNKLETLLFKTTTTYIDSLLAKKQ